MKSILHKVVYVLYVYLKFELMALNHVLKEKQITETNILSYRYNGMSTGIDGECPLVLPVCSVCRTNPPPNH